MSDEQRYAFPDGSVAPFDLWSAPKPRCQREVLEKAFGGLSNLDFNWVDKTSKIRHVEISEGNGNRIIVKFAMRSVSGGGRAKQRPNELRVQCDPKTNNDLFQINENGGIGLIIGIYCIEGSFALAIWRPLDKSSGAKTSSKQINAHVVAAAMVNGVSKYT
ncbi:MAG: hypothetical protein RR889_09195, partial [Akkermansia sp.]